jgi:hypothetical protein
MAASVTPLESALVTLAVEAKPSTDLWTTDPTGITKALRHLQDQIRRTIRKK